MSNLNTRTQFHNVIISLKNVNVGNTLERLKEYCNSNYQVYGFIVHDKDVGEDGTPKTPHIHLVGIYRNNRTRLSTTIKEMSENVFVSTLAISIDKASDLNGSFQYLIHKNNESKHQYDIEEIITNLSREELDVYLQRPSNGVSLEKIIEVITFNQSKIQIMRLLGFEVYARYRNVINDIYYEIHEAGNFVNRYAREE